MKNYYQLYEPIRLDDNSVDLLAEKKDSISLANVPAGILPRLSLVVGFVAISVCLLLFGDYHFDGDVFFLLSFYLAWVPILIAGCTIPFLVARAFFGWFLFFKTDSEISENRLTVSSFLVGTAMIACCLMLLGAGGQQQQLAAVVAAIACFGAGLVIGLPVTLLILSDQPDWRRVIQAALISLGPPSLLVFVYLFERQVEIAYGAIALCCMLASYCCFLALAIK